MACFAFDAFFARLGDADAAIFVPWPHSGPLRPFLQDEPEHEESAWEPRYAVTVSWGANYEPWLTAVELLTP